MQREAILTEARDIADGIARGRLQPRKRGHRAGHPSAPSRAIALIGGALAHRRRRGRRRASPCAGASVDFRARTGVERWMMILLFGASLIAILTTLGIFLSLMFESLRFFRLYPVGAFLFGTEWSPQTAIRADQAGSSGAFGSIPLLWGTFFIGAIIAMIVAIPLGPDERHLPHPICRAARARLCSSRRSRCSPACRPWSTAISRR